MTAVGTAPLVDPRPADTRLAQLDALQVIAQTLRARVVQMSHEADAPHLGSCLSCIDILVAAYWGVLRLDLHRPLAPDRDRFILSKGHAAMALYAALAFRGFFPEAELDAFNSDGGVLAEHPAPHCAPGVEAATGSLGHGLSIALGMALAARISGADYRVYALLSDGECNEGSVWEAALFAPAHRLEHVCAIVDYNKWQATGRSDHVLALPSLREKWQSFGWSACEVDGHAMGELIDRMGSVPDGSGKPVAIIAHTVKGKGVSFMEDDNNWHYRIPTADEVEHARLELIGR